MSLNSMAAILDLDRSKCSSLAKLVRSCFNSAAYLFTVANEKQSSSKLRPTRLIWICVLSFKCKTIIKARLFFFSTSTKKKDLRRFTQAIVTHPLSVQKGCNWLHMLLLHQNYVDYSYWSSKLFRLLKYMINMQYNKYA